MVVLSTDAGEVVLHDAGYHPGALYSRFNLHAAAPVILGLVAPFLVIALIEPKALAHIQFMVSVVLVCAMIACIFIYTFSVLSPGPVTSVRINRRAKRLVLERCGRFANNLQEVAFADIAALKMVQDFDQDGYGTVEPMIILRSRATLPLPAGTSEPILKALRPILGCR